MTTSIHLINVGLLEVLEVEDTNGQHHNFYYRQGKDFPFWEGAPLKIKGGTMFLIYNYGPKFIEIYNREENSSFVVEPCSSMDYGFSYNELEITEQR